jgi:hypothetical protein
MVVTRTVQYDPEATISARASNDLAMAAMTDVQDARVRNSGHWMTRFAPLILGRLAALMHRIAVSWVGPRVASSPRWYSPLLTSIGSATDRTCRP